MVDDCQTHDDVKRKIAARNEWRKRQYETPKPAPVKLVIAPPSVPEPVVDTTPIIPPKIQTLLASAEQLTYCGIPRPIKIRDIQELVCHKWGVDMADLISPRRPTNIIEPRQVSYVLCKALTLRSLPEIGRLFGGRDHTTILHGIRKMDWLLKQLRAELTLQKPLCEWVDRAYAIVRGAKCRP